MTRWEEKFLSRIENTSNDFIDVKEIEIGRVISVEPLQVMIGELPLFKENLYINADLLENTKEFSILQGTIGDSRTTISNGSITFKQQLKINDLIALRSIGDKKYLLICKVV